MRGIGPVSKRDEAVMAYIAKDRPKLEQIRYHLNLTNDQARDTVMKLRKHGLIHSVRFGKTKRWCVTADLERTNEEAVEYQRQYEEHRKSRFLSRLDKMQAAKKLSAMRGDEPAQIVTKTWAPIRKRGPASVWELADRV